MKIANYKELFLDITKRLVSVKSFITKPEEWPSKEQKKVLEEFVKISKELGFKTKHNPQGKWAYAEIGEGKKIIGILGHLDVVPPGNIQEWKSNPFILQIKKDKIIGRGVIDDKGPIAASMITLKKVLDSNVKMNKRIRIIVGTDEETLWRGIEDYTKKEEIPYIAFTPDSQFPMTYAEKDLLQLKIKGNGTKLIKFNFDNSFNVVPPIAKYSGKFLKEIEKNAKDKKIEYKIVGKTIDFVGNQKHAKDAADGYENAVVNLVKCLPKELDKISLIKFIKENISDGQATNVFGNIKDKVSGKLTFNIAKLIINEKESYIGVDSRIPVEAYSLKKFESTIIKKLKKYDLEYERYDYLPPVYFKKNSKIIKTMFKSYKKITNRNEKLISSGGATYARAIPNCIAFGARFVEEPATEHMPNETASIKYLLLASDVYYDFLLKELDN